jgi:hypothetical protein
MALHSKLPNACMMLEGFLSLGCPLIPMHGRGCNISFQLMGRGGGLMAFNGGVVPFESL